MVRHEAQHQKTGCGCEALILGWEIADLSPISRCKIPVDKKTQEQDLHLLTQSQTSTSSPRARPPPPHPEQDLHLLTQSQTSTSCQKSSRTAERRG
ncbi:unnamed protein product [Boreogadus saida]